MMKSCRTPSMLTVYSSVSPGRMKRASLSATSTLPVDGRAATDLAKRLEMTCSRFRSAQKRRQAARTPNASRHRLGFGEGIARHRDSATLHLRGRHTETVVHRGGNSRSQPQAFARGLAFEPLEHAAQPRASGVGLTARPSPW